MRPLLEVDALRVELPTREGTVRAVDGVSFTVAAGEVLGVVGRSGSGKSMTALSLLGLLPEASRVSGRVLFEGEDLLRAGEARLARVRGDRIALIFQDALAALNPYLTVGVQLAEVLEAHRGVGRREAWRRAVEMLDRVGIAAPSRRAHDRPHQLSGGMRQRVLIAMALLCDPALIVADEPTSALDATVAAQILELLREQQEAKGTSIVLITHDLGVLAGLADRALVMNGGRVVEEGPVARLLSEPREGDTRELVEAIARVDAPLSEPEPEPEPDSQKIGLGLGLGLGLGRNGDADDAPVLSVRDLAVSFPVRRGFLGLSAGTVRAVDGISFDVARGEVLGVVGESGSGKSTAARAILRLVPARGVVRLAGRDLSALDGAALRRARRDAQMIFQDPYASLDPRMTVLESVAEPLLLHDLARSRRDAAPAVAALLESVGLDPRFAGRYPHELSGGQRQRVGIARAVALRPRIVLADEPVSALDAGVRAQIVELLGALSREHGLALVLISHDLAAVRRLARRVAVMYLGRIVELAPAAAIFAAPSHPYTRALLAAAMVPPPTDRRRLVLAGEAPSPEAPPPGCAFHPRCPEAEARCRTEAPALTARGDARGERSVACHLAT